MKRWIAGFLALVVTVPWVAGCGSKCFISEKDFYAAHDLPVGLEEGNAAALVQPTLNPTAAPATVEHPDRPARYLSLPEALALALENGATGSRNGGVTNPGIADDSPAVV